MDWFMRQQNEKGAAAGRVGSKRLRAAAVGIATLKDWLGEGGVPVPSETAERRAMVCKHGLPDLKPCPKNWTRGDWWTRVSAFVATAVMNERRAKAQLELRVTHEEMLGTCDVCLCHLPTKIWIPIEVILHRTSEEVWNQLPPHCWIKREGSELRERQNPAP